MPCVSISEFPPTLVAGAITAIKYKDFPAPTGDCDGVFIDDLFLISGVVVPANSTTQYTVKIGAFDFRGATVVNTTGSTTFNVLSGAIAVSADGKQIDFNDIGGNPRTVNINDGLWADGFSVVVACVAIPGGSVISPVNLDYHEAQFSMEPDSNFTGSNPPDIPQVLDGEVTTDAIDPTKQNITIQWEEPAGGATPLIYEIQRSTDGSTWSRRGFVTNNTTQFTDGWVGLTADQAYHYRVRALRKLNLPDAGDAGISGFSNTFSLVYTTPDLIVSDTAEILVGDSAVVATIVNPSGIYTLVANKTNDTLYERTGVTTQVVQIPDPFFVTGYLPDD